MTSFKNPGNTKLIRLKKIEKKYNLSSFLYAKDESTNPTGSIKDRTVFFMLNKYKEEDLLKDNGIVIEATSGNTGISLAYYSKVFNYKAIIIMPSSASIERSNMIKHYGGEVLLVEGGMKECEEKAKILQKTYQNSLIFNQFANLNNHLAHYNSTAPEIYKEMDDVDYIVAGFGTGGTVSGVGKFFKEKNHKTVIIGVEPMQSPLITKGFSNTHKIQGIGANFIPDNFIQKYVDEIIDVDDQKSIEIAREIFEEEGLFVGVSSGAALLGAIEYIKKKNISDKKFVIIFPDKGDRYSW